MAYNPIHQDMLQSGGQEIGIVQYPIRRQPNPTIILDIRMTYKTCIFM